MEVDWLVESDVLALVELVDIDVETLVDWLVLALVELVDADVEIDVL